MWLGSEESGASPLVTRAGRAEELIRLVSVDVRKPFKADRRGLLTPRGHATLGAAPPAITEWGAWGALWEAGGKGKGRPANTEDKGAGPGVLVGAAVAGAAKGRLTKGADVEANASLGAGGARGAAAAQGPGSGTRPGKTEGTGVDVALWADVTGAASREGVRMTVGFGASGGAGAAAETCPGNTGRTVFSRLSPGAAADAGGWPAALTGDTVGTGVAAGVAGLDPCGAKSWLAGAEKAVGGKQKCTIVLRRQVLNPNKCTAPLQ